MPHVLVQFEHRLERAVERLDRLFAAGVARAAPAAAEDGQPCGARDRLPLASPAFGRLRDEPLLRRADVMRAAAAAAAAATAPRRLARRRRQPTRPFAAAVELEAV